MNLLESIFDTKNEYKSIVIPISFLGFLGGILYLYLFNLDLFLELDWIKLIFLSLAVHTPIFIFYLVVGSLFAAIISIGKQFKNETEEDEELVVTLLIWLMFSLVNLYSSIAVKYFFDFSWTNSVISVSFVCIFSSIIVSLQSLEPLINNAKT